MNKKQAYIEKFEAQLKERTTKIEELEAKPDRAGADVRLQYSKEIDK